MVLQALTEADERPRETEERERHGEVHEIAHRVTSIRSGNTGPRKEVVKRWRARVKNAQNERERDV